MDFTNYRQLVFTLYREHVESPGAVDRSWQSFFEGIEGAELTEGMRIDAGRIDAYRTAMILGRVIENFRWRGHMAANLDPLGLSPPVADPDIVLDRIALSIGDETMTTNLGGELRLFKANVELVIARLEKIYCGTIGYEYMHLDNAVAREWLRREIEFDDGMPETEIRLKGARRLIEADEFEKFVQRRFVAKKLFGAEGAESLLSLLWCMLEHGVASGLRSVVIGGTSRARLNQLVNFVGKPATAVIKEITDKSVPSHEPARSGDVPYHLGYTSQRTVGDTEVSLSYCANPSHLEAVNTVALGRVRAMQDDLGGGDEAKDAIMALLIHTDAAFAGQGVVAEAFQLGGLRSYSAGGAIHVVINNQLGFTTQPSDGRSSRYCSDAAKGIGAPVFHVNADDVDAVLRVGRLAMEYRKRFRSDVVVDLVCYRRKGHNELDEPTFTQPLMYSTIATHPTTRRIYLDRLRNEGVLTEEQEEGIAAKYREGLIEAHNASAAYKPNLHASLKTIGQDSVGGGERGATGLPAVRLREIGAALTRIPAGVEAHAKVTRIFAERAACLKSGSDINWGFAEALALGSLIAEGTPVRLSGQDTPRGAFSHRHYFVHDQKDSRRALIFDNLPQPRARATVFESLLAEYAPLGFEYGYSLEATKALVVWEAQFGDFANVAQPIFDQFITSGDDKWGEPSRLAVLMPHGLEGQGSEHSSGRIERFLQMCAKDNMTVANCTTPANYFHLLRRQAKVATTPLVVFSPKSLLRHKLAVSTLADMGANTGFRKLIGPGKPSRFNRIILCSGKLYWELEAERRLLNLDDVGIARIEQLYPFPAEEITAMVQAYPKATFVWCQEEPRNMGAWSFVAPLITEILRQRRPGAEQPVYYGRPSNPSPAIGTAALHAVHQARIIELALGGDS